MNFAVRGNRMTTALGPSRPAHGSNYMIRVLKLAEWLCWKAFRVFEIGASLTGMVHDAIKEQRQANQYRDAR